MKMIVRCHPLGVVDVGGTVLLGPVAAWTASARQSIQFSGVYRGVASLNQVGALRGHTLGVGEQERRGPGEPRPPKSFLALCATRLPLLEPQIYSIILYLQLCVELFMPM